MSDRDRRHDDFMEQEIKNLDQMLFTFDQVNTWPVGDEDSRRLMEHAKQKLNDTHRFE